MKLTVGRVSGLKLPSGKTDHIAWDDDVPGLGCASARAAHAISYSNTSSASVTAA